MICLGVGGRFLEALRSLYHAFTFAVLARGCVVDFLPPLAGLTHEITDQGSPSKPTLFTVFTYGIIRHLHAVCSHVGRRWGKGSRLSAIINADDIELLSDAPDGMTLLLDAVSDWCPVHDMVVNPSKSEPLKSLN